jgi:hypothetical protein
VSSSTAPLLYLARQTGVQVGSGNVTRLAWTLLPCGVLLRGKAVVPQISVELLAVTRSETREQSRRPTPTKPEPSPTALESEPGSGRASSDRTARGCAGRGAVDVLSLLPHGSLPAASFAISRRAVRPLELQQAGTRCRCAITWDSPNRRCNSRCVGGTFMQPHSLTFPSAAVLTALLERYAWLLRDFRSLFSLKALCPYQSFGFPVRAILTLSASVTRNVVITGYVTRNAR